MLPSFAQIVVWIVVGLIAGTLVGRVVTWDRKGFGFWRNLLLGLLGAIVGGLVVRLSGILPGLDAVAISLRDVVAGLFGALVLLGVLWAWRRVQTPS